jgi:hypothetical protein
MHRLSKALAFSLAACGTYVADAPLDAGVNNSTDASVLFVDSGARFDAKEEPDAAQVGCKGTGTVGHFCEDFDDALRVKFGAPRGGGSLTLVHDGGAFSDPAFASAIVLPTVIDNRAASYPELTLPFVPARVFEFSLMVLPERVSAPCSILQVRYANVTIVLSLNGTSVSSLLGIVGDAGNPILTPFTDSLTMLNTWSNIVLRVDITRGELGLAVEGRPMKTWTAPTSGYLGTDAIIPRFMVGIVGAAQTNTDVRIGFDDVRVKSIP